MANITITFSNPLPVNIQIGDIAWYLESSTENAIKMGPIISISNLTIVIEAETGVSPPSTSDFVFYEVNPIASVGQLKGYFSEIQFRNNTTAYAELFSVGTEVFESSK